MKTIRIIALSLFISFIYLGCGKECKDDTNPECPNYNPCKGKTGNYATFRVLDVDYSSCAGHIFCEDRITEFPINADTFYNNTLKFEANYPDAISYQWKIGAGEYDKRSFVLGGFPDVGIPVPITLIVNYAPNKCREENRTSDTFTRIIQRGSIPLKKEVWQGYDIDKPSEIYTWTFDTLTKTFVSTGNKVHFYTIFKDSRKNCSDTCGSGSSGSFSNSNRQAIGSSRKPRWSSGEFSVIDCSGYDGYFSILYDSLRTEIKMKYYFTYPSYTGEPNPKTFIGKRIQ
jgi:hypothetical protein